MKTISQFLCAAAALLLAAQSTVHADTDAAKRGELAIVAQLPAGVALADATLAQLSGAAVAVAKANPNAAADLASYLASRLPDSAARITTDLVRAAPRVAADVAGAVAGIVPEQARAVFEAAVAQVSQATGQDLPNAATIARAVMAKAGVKIHALTSDPAIIAALSGALPGIQAPEIPTPDRDAVVSPPRF
jgi:hypothetical protein